MVEFDKERFKNLMKATFEVYGKDPSAMAMRLWWNCLERYSIEQVEMGLAAHIQCPDRGQFTPKPADVIAKIGGDRNDRKDAGEFAWARVMDAQSKHGSYASVAFDDPAIHFAIEVAFGSWPKIGQLSVDDPFPRKEFCSAYAAYKPERGHLKYFPGISETNNSAEGQADWIPEVVCIGDASKVKAVMFSGRNGLSDMTSIGSAVELRSIEGLAA